MTNKKLKKKVPAVVLSVKPSVWMSCRIIEPNLEQANRDYFGKEANYFSITVSMSRNQIWDVAREIISTNPSKIVFMSHVPHPKELLIALAELNNEKPLPPLYFHVYGDFTLYTGEWLSVNSLLMRSRVKFICASDRQVSLVSRFLSKSPGAVNLCHFPVNIKQYYSDQKIREEWRKELKLKPDDFAVFYTGRLSLQKNLLKLTSEIYKFSEEKDVNVRFFLVGSFDDLGAPFFGIEFPKGYYFQYWNEKLKEFPSHFRKKVSYLGQHDASTLKGLYNAADLFTSLSLHHDEDYGMSPAEALCCGTPVLLSDWGGYSSFFENDSSCQLVPVRIGQKGLVVSSNTYQKKLFELYKLDRSELARKERSSKFQQKLSIQKASDIIKTIHKYEAPQFGGFGWRMQKHVELFNEEIPFVKGPVKGTFYEEIYGAYTGTAIE